MNRNNTTKGDYARYLSIWLACLHAPTVHKIGASCIQQVMHVRNSSKCSILHTIVTQRLSSGRVVRPVYYPYALNIYHNDGAETGELICAVGSTHALPNCSLSSGAHVDVRQRRKGNLRRSRSRSAAKATAGLSLLFFLLQQCRERWHRKVCKHTQVALTPEGIAQGVVMVPINVPVAY
eukprot:5072975-Pleurochrysis_carterae.AAC.2